jgi:hypothetical protein
MLEGTKEKVKKLFKKKT